MSEFDWIARIAGRVPQPPKPAVGIGDDCAITPPHGFSLAWKVDAVVEGVHFRREWISLEDAAARGVEAALSDLAATGATIAWEPHGGAGLLWALTLPTETSDGDIDALATGCARAARRVGAVVLGGNLTRGPVLSMTTTAIGRIEGRALTRHGARVGDGVYVTGPMGAAALGVRALSAGRGDDPHFAAFVRAWRAPTARLDVSPQIARIATATIDVSDGLAQDLLHIADASSVGIVLDADLVPTLARHEEAAAALGVDALECVLDGGEDYEVCFAAPDGAIEHIGLRAWRIGDVVAGSGVRVRSQDIERAYEPAGWDHFRGAKP